MKSLGTILFVAVLCLGWSAPVKAGDIVYGDIYTVLRVAKGFGNAEIKRMRNGDRYIACWANGVPYSIFFPGCKTGKRCDTLQFWSGWKAEESLRKKFDDWLIQHRFLKSVGDKRNVYRVGMDVVMRGGMTRRCLRTSFEIWDGGLYTLKKHMLDEIE